MNGVHELQKFSREEFHREASQDFFTLRRVPSTEVCRFLKYYSELSKTDQEAFAVAASIKGAMNLGAADLNDLHEQLMKNEAWCRWANWSVMNGWRFPSIASLRLRAARPTLEHAQGTNLESGQGVKDLAATAQGANANELRKCVKTAFVELFNASASNRGGGCWLYEGHLSCATIAVNLNYMNRLHYEVNVETASPPYKLQKIGYERVLGVGFGQWDYIVQENKEDSIRLLAEFVTYTADLPRRLASCFTGAKV